MYIEGRYFLILISSLITYMGSQMVQYVQLNVNDCIVKLE